MTHLCRNWSHPEVDHNHILGPLQRGGHCVKLIKIPIIHDKVCRMGMLENADFAYLVFAAKLPVTQWVDQKPVESRHLWVLLAPPVSRWRPLPSLAITIQIEIRLRSFALESVSIPLASQPVPQIFAPIQWSRAHASALSPSVNPSFAAVGSEARLPLCSRCHNEGEQRFISCPL